ncbi:MAG: hypothetical protein EOP04_29375 [Proteobacteria bacterium]|nr:MAG: hypothetical protein EOP04_29375 [Pseudomonadota bacterium]
MQKKIWSLENTKWKRTMPHSKKVLAITLARGGSKSVPRKNIRKINGVPLIAYTIGEALRSMHISRFIVSTDDEEIAQELRARAKDALLTQALASEEELENTDPAEDLLTMEGMDRPLAFVLASIGIRTMEDLAEQSVDDLLDIEGMTEKRAASLIMAARAPWFADSK